MFELGLTLLVLVEALVSAAARGMFDFDTDHVWDLATAIVGGVIGALAGGVPAYLLAVKATQESAAKDEATQLTIDLAILQSAFVKLLEIVNGSYTLCEQINGMLYEAHAGGRGGWRLWQKVQPLLAADAGAPVQFSSQEIALFMRHEESVDFANALTMIDKRYETLRASIKAYSDRRERLMDMLPVLDLNNGIGRSELNQEQAAKVIPLAHALDSVADHIITAMHVDRREAARLSEEFNGHAKRLFPGRRVPGFQNIGARTS